ncbi:hypothetical protein C8R47DRAFT_1220861 [Mycena vitilis]|nr:hypothetical protein C8R47DRAFT_1220861 [Mycena vitilis]
MQGNVHISCSFAPLLGSTTGTRTTLMQAAAFLAFAPAPHSIAPPPPPSAPAVASRPGPQQYHGRAGLKLRLMRPYAARPVQSGGGGSPGCAWSWYRYTNDPRPRCARSNELPLRVRPFLESAPRSPVDAHRQRKA